MNVLPKLKEALLPLGLPVSARFKLGGENYIVYNESSNGPEDFADDEAQTDVATVQVHYFTLREPCETVRAIRRALRTAGFRIQGTSELYESETRLIHTVIEAEIYGLAEEQENKEE